MKGDSSSEYVKRLANHGQLTTDQKIADLEWRANEALSRIDSMVAIAYELRALRLMLREEIREAAWRIPEPVNLEAMTKEQHARIHHAPYDEEAGR